MGQRSRAGVFAVLVGSASFAQVTQRVSVSSSGVEGDNYSHFPSISPDGRFVVFPSRASNLVADDANGGIGDVFVRDRQLGTTDLVSVAFDGTHANAESELGSPSGDGRYVSFLSTASNLVPGDTNGIRDVFVRDRLLGTTELASMSSGGIPANGQCYAGYISADGRYVVFGSPATNLVPGDTNGFHDVFVRDRQNGTTEIVSTGLGGVPANGSPTGSSMSADGRFVTFGSTATNLIAADTNGTINDIFVRDRQSNTTECVSISSTGVQTNNWCQYDTISADGRYVAFISRANNLVPGDTNGLTDVFWHDRMTGSTERVSVSTNGAEGNDECEGGSKPSLSADGRFVAFRSLASNLVTGDTNGSWDVFIRDRQDGITELVSVDSEDMQGVYDSAHPSVSADGRLVAFTSFAHNLVPADSNGVLDVFVRDQLGGTNFTSLCDPGMGGVIVCPCANAPSAPGRGCDNSSGTGGAILSASGGTFLSSDSLVFATRGERPTALSIVTQWAGASAAGLVFGQGVRCASGTLKRLYTKAASGGSITAPEFAAGDPTVSARSAAKGDVIQPGQSRWYLVYYRDPIVLGGCPATSAFNATQTGEVAWSP